MAIFTYQCCDSLAWFTLCLWCHSLLLMTLQMHYVNHQLWHKHVISDIQLVRYRFYSWLENMICVCMFHDKCKFCITVYLLFRTNSHDASWNWAWKLLNIIYCKYISLNSSFYSNALKICIGIKVWMGCVFPQFAVSFVMIILISQPMIIGVS